MKRHLLRGSFLPLALVLFASVGARHDVQAQVRRPRLLAQRGPRMCSVDTDCRIAHLPAPRACPSGGQSVATACCRMNYCGICWSDCPPH